MLTGTELALAIAAVLFGAVLLGALLHWLWARSGSGPDRDAHLAERLHEAEMRREAAELTLQEAEERAGRREDELRRELAEARADLDTLHGGLVNARQRMIELEAELERLRGTRQDGESGQGVSG